ncbi:MAG: class I SAM-dependent methyltransferase [Leptospiraceae bacterium]|nr:class I SAM-dependent methyltransferase [Leptospiraceae bacterium]
MKEGKPSETAQIVCLMRALEHEWKKDNSLLQDKYAKHFLQGRFQLWLNLLSGPVGKLFFPTYQWLYDAAILRSALMDEYIIKYAHTMPVVLLGAGFDSRSLRLKPYLKQGIYEIDFHATQELKKQILNSQNYDTSHVSYHTADFTQKTLYEILEPLQLKNRPVILIWEGVTMYLEEALIYDTIKTIGQYFAKGTYLIADYWLHSFPLPGFILNPIRDMFSLFWDEPIVFGTFPEELERKIRKINGPKYRSYNYENLSKHFAVNRTLFSPFFTAVLEY